MIIFISITIIFNFIITNLINRISIRSTNELKEEIFAKTLSLKTLNKKNFHNSFLLTVTTQDTEQIKAFLNTFLSIIFKAPILLILCLQVLTTIGGNFYYILIPAITILLIYLIVTILKLFPISKKMQANIDNLNKMVKEKITGFSLIKSYNKLDYVDTKFEDECNAYLNSSKKVIQYSSLITPILTLLANSIIIALLVKGVISLENAPLQVGTLIASIQYILQSLLSIIMLLTIIILIPKYKICLNRINTIMKSSSYIESDKVMLNNIDKLCFDNVTFFNKENKILDNISMTINKGEKIGIIGPTGSGKTTLISLLLKEQEAKEGTISINNENIANLTRKDITNNITYIPQTNYLIKGTIIENLKFINPYVSNEDLQKAIYTSSSKQIIEKSKDLLNYQIEESGANLSGGEKQRLCIARALTSPANFLIFDDSFSSLDYKTEKEIINNLFSLYNNKTLIFISQKISTVKDCDKIIVMDKGKIIDCNTHENLIKKCSLYKNMYQTQKEVLEYDI